MDSPIYGGAWNTDEMRAIFDDLPCLQGWLDVIAALAEAQAELGIIPAEAAPEIRRVCSVDLLDIAAVQRGYAETGHSMLGLIRELKKLCRGAAGEWVYYGATVQDITDTYTAIALRRVWQIVFRDLRRIETNLLALAVAHRDTPMAGRTHGQPGQPITFGYKAAVWVSEIRRHLERLKDVARRMGEGQLAGGVGSLSSYGERGFELQETFLTRLGLRAPDISWISARDTQVEFMNLLAMIAATFEKIGHEIYNLQRPEIGEVREGFVPGTVGSITMPHKRNPEIAEHLGTLARIIRHQANCLAESLVHEHERDGRSWKVEWGVIGPACGMMGALLRLSKTMCANLEVDGARMLANLDATRGNVLSEGIMLALAGRAGKQTAHDLVYRAAMFAAQDGRPLKAAILEQAEIAQYLSAGEIDALFDERQPPGLCPQLVDRVVASTNALRQTDSVFLATDVHLSNHIAVVAIGGNALIKDPKRISAADQYAAVCEAVEHIATLIKSGWCIVIGHGNGPQVGFARRRSELAARELPEEPLDVCNANTQGWIGYFLQQALHNSLRQEGCDARPVTVVTQVEVDPNDPAFQNPTKPIGDWMDKELAMRRQAEGWTVMEDAGRGWRYVVPSPMPKRIVEECTITRLIESGTVVITVGGGGIPVVADENGSLHGVPAVIDKDLSCALLASKIGAEVLVLSTSVEKVALNFGKPNMVWLDRLSLAQAKQYLAEGIHFAKGSMAPKIEAAVKYLESGGGHVIITNTENIGRAMAGETGTHITRE